MKNKLPRPLLTLISVIFWITAWQIGASIVGNAYFLPDIPTTLFAFTRILGKWAFYRAVFATLLRVAAGLALGTVFGIALAVLSHKSSVIKAIISPIILVIKSTPVATFTILLWIALSGTLLPVFVAFLMVMPIIWQNVLDAYGSIDKNLSEVCNAFELTRRARAKLLIFPALHKYLIPAFITSCGLAWKSEIAAEIIAYTTRSIGQFISDAKYDFDTPLVFASTIVVILLSIALEKGAGRLLMRFKL